MGAVHLDPFDELIRQLRAKGLPAAADSLASIKASAWTTSSQMLGELGMAVLKIQSENAQASSDLKRALTRCIEEVRKVWPQIRLP
jgi:hypothetical protein